MPTNDPYSRPINATKPTAVRVGEHYGTVSTVSTRSVAAGNAHAAPAIGSTQPYERPNSTAALPVFPRKDLVTTVVSETALNVDVTSPSDDELIPEPVITEDDLFG